MTAPYPDPDQFPAEFSAGERATLSALKAWQEEAREVADAKHEENKVRFETVDREMKAMAAAMKAAFPDGDPDGHRRYHESIIAKNESRTRMYEAVRDELVSKGMWAAIGLIAVSIWYFIWNHKP